MYRNFGTVYHSAEMSFSHANASISGDTRAVGSTSTCTHADISFEEVAKLPLPGMNVPNSISFSPDGQIVSYLQSNENELTNNLYGVHIPSHSKSEPFQAPDLLATPPNSGNTEVNLSLEERLRRERQRQLGVGITSYTWSPTSLGSTKRLLYPIQGDLYIQEDAGSQLALLFDKLSTGVAGGAIDPQFSPDGKYIAFVQDREIYVIPSTHQDSTLPVKAVQVTKGARNRLGISNGLACFLTQEELSRYRGFWWSPDSRHIAFEQVDESEINEYRIMHQGGSTLGRDAQEDHRYPFAGKENPRRRLGIVRVRTEIEEIDGTIWMRFETVNLLNEDFYISRVNWLPDQSLGVQRLNRSQTELTFVRFDSNGKGTVLLAEQNSVWVNAHYLYRGLEMHTPSGFRFVWGSERTGHMHLYLYEYNSESMETKLLGPLTQGKWNVESIEGISSSQDKIFFCGTLDSPLERHLYAASLNPIEIENDKHIPIRLTKEQGMHTIVMDRFCRAYVDLYSTLETPPSAHLVRIPQDAHVLEHEALLSILYENRFPLYDKIESRVTKLQNAQKLPPPRILSFSTSDNQAILYGAVYMPDAEIHGSGPYPTLVNVYGGPHVQRVAHTWAMTVDMRAQRFRQLGYAVLKVDNRGSYRRGLAFEGAIKNRMGTIEVQDQRYGVSKLVTEGITDPQRVGIYGWSYGGYMSAISLLKAPETYKLAIAGAPVTSWDGYDTCYTERYMSTPELNQTGYRQASVMEFVSQMQPHQKLLLIHGLIDENVHFRHTARLINALINAQKPYDLLLFPSERHSPRHLEDRIYMERCIAKYVVAHL
uniref:Putative dipeptidyl peptidase IV n=1 Tax=Albugo laibachii Nc14 TaxID=890382 RepID=F0WVE8_9STRA|nr:putative dipeptidyl peptidase IV [Albugo laibachii Nc14]CCA25462.1 putative dipeptidyl peptidase IV [Albugo laibachii Nc14]|eukprot:CCA25462.1 putative dipeptidyl peptidase IV [Albugo laibachii Nc14]